MRRFFVVTLLVVTTACMFGAASAGKKAGHIEYEEYELSNGLRVILSEDRSVPIVAVNIWFHVGSGHEEEGRSGFAHLFEHMMFQGSENLGKTEHGELVERAGGRTNASTTSDRTNYYEVLPANRLNLALWLESDRMRSLNISEKNFENQRHAVREERKQSYENRPYGIAFLTSDTLSYNFKPYRHTTIGKMADLDNAPVEDVQKFFDKYYSPNNAVLTIVGDIDKKKTMKLVEKYFGDLPRGEEVERISGTEPPHEAERRVVLEDKNANVPAIFMTYNTPPHLHPDSPALELLGKILTDGEASRMYQRLVKEEQVAVVVFGGTDSRIGPSLFRFVAASNIGVDIGTCEDMILEELERLKTDGISDQELEKAKIQFKAGFVLSRGTVLDKAESLQHYAYFHDDLADINSDLDRYMAVTGEDIMRVANKYFVRNNATIVIANPASN